MSVPSVIRIRCIPDYRTETIGRHRNGQFIADIVGDERSLLRAIAILHLFDHAGVYVSSTVRVEESWASAIVVRDSLLAQLEAVSFGDVGVRLFSFEEDGRLFGLVDESGRHGDLDWVEMYPERLGFTAPWDGNYDT